MAKVTDPTNPEYVMPANGKKHDSDKPRVDLLPTFPLVCVGRVLGFGAKKYDAHNWRGGIAYSRLYGAILRHLYAWADGEDTDEETGFNHLDHALTECMFLRQMVKDRPDLDDRFKK